MINFSEEYKVPMMDRECFEADLAHASSFGVWVQASPLLQTCLTITKEQIVELANFGFNSLSLPENKRAESPIYAQFSIDGRLTLSLPSQWLDEMKERESLKKSAMAKLTFEERDALGLTKGIL